VPPQLSFESPFYLSKPILFVWLSQRASFALAFSEPGTESACSCMAYITSEIIVENILLRNFYGLAKRRR
jgi:hypothetical protein